MYPEGRPEGALPLLGMRGRLGSEQGPVGGGCCGRVDAACDEWFFLLHAAKVRSSCEEGPGQSALQSAYHNPKLDVTELKQNRTP